MWYQIFILQILDNIYSLDISLSKSTEIIPNTCIHFQAEGIQRFQQATLTFKLRKFVNKVFFLIYQAQEF